MTFFFVECATSLPCGCHLAVLLESLLDFGQSASIVKKRNLKVWHLGVLKSWVEWVDPKVTEVH